MTAEKTGDKLPIEIAKRLFENASYFNVSPHSKSDGTKCTGYKAVEIEQAKDPYKLSGKCNGCGTPLISATLTTGPWTKVE